MRLSKNIFLEDLGLFLKEERVLIIADIHIGYEEEMNKRGILIPRFHQEEIMEKIERMLKNIRPHKVIINGDLKHEFGTISETEWKHTFEFLDLIKKYCKEIILVRGNHDTILKPIADKKELTVKDYYNFRDYYVVHGDKIPKNKNFEDSDRKSVV